MAVAKQLFEKGDFLFNFDLKSAYHHIEILRDHRKYLGFAWNDGNKRVFYQFNVLLFGLATAPHIFTKLTRVIVSHWRSQGLRVIMYLDDGLGGSRTFEEAEWVSDNVKKSLQELGFLIAHEKSEWKPSQIVTWLGFNWHTDTGVLQATSERIERAILALTFVIYQVNVSKNNLVPVRFLASVVGQIISLPIQSAKWLD